MADQYVNVNGVWRKADPKIVVVDGVNRQVQNTFVVDNGVIRKCWDNYAPVNVSFLLAYIGYGGDGGDWTRHEEPTQIGSVSWTETRYGSAGLRLKSISSTLRITSDAINEAIANGYSRAKIRAWGTNRIATSGTYATYIASNQMRVTIADVKGLYSINTDNKNQPSYTTFDNSETFAFTNAMRSNGIMAWCDASTYQGQLYISFQPGGEIACRMSIEFLK